MTREELTKKIADIDAAIENLKAQANQLAGAKAAYEDVLKALDSAESADEDDVERAATSE